MTTIVFDIEADAIDATKIWCIVGINSRTNEISSFGPDKIAEGIEYLKSADKLVGHNISAMTFRLSRDCTALT